MGWRGTMRSIAAAQRRAEREERRRQRELERRRKELARMEELERARFEVEEYENYLDVLMSIHKECGPEWDWAEIASSSPPSKPKREDELESKAKEALAQFKPGVLDKLLRRVDKKREALKTAVASSAQQDEDTYQEAMRQHEVDLKEWQQFREISAGILAGDVDLFIKAIEAVDPFSELSGLGSRVNLSSEDPNFVEAILYPHGEDVIPKEAKSLLKSGKLSVKNMPKTRFYELYQDYVSGCVLRVARELFALLPIEMSFVTAVSPLLNTKTGHMEDQPILSAAILRKTIDPLNFEYLDPSDSLTNFVHNMNFRKTKGFTAVERIMPSSFQTR